MIELRHLRYFVAVAEELHFGRAATRLHMAQSPLSQQIRQLERLVGTELIDRPHAVVGLTDAGRVMLDDARAILAAVDGAVERARRTARGEAGLLRVGYVGEVTVDLLPLGLKAFKDRHPEVRLELTEGDTGVLLDRLRARDLDVVFSRAPRTLGELVYEQLVEERFMLARPEGALPAADRHQLCELRPPAWIVPGYDHARGLRQDIEHAFVAAGCEVGARREASSLTAALLLVAGGAGWALVPASTAHLYPVPGVDYAHLEEALTTTAGMAWRRDTRSEVVAGFLDTVREVAEHHLGQPDVWPERRVVTGDPAGDA
ncbi:MAG TPA: LysR substrate-binding domain-containing protein [Acidimicrobiales bacterium]|nr:LysR substrate-binding domain-containing protein [Acidimicrobiales bacterium]